MSRWICSGITTPGDHELIVSAYLLQHKEKQIPAARPAQQRLATITAAGDEMQVSSAVIALEIVAHDSR